MAEKLMRHATNTAYVLKASSFVLACNCTVCVHSLYSLKLHGVSHIATAYKRLLRLCCVLRQNKMLGGNL